MRLCETKATLSLGNGYGQGVLGRHGICFQSTRSLNNPDFLEPADARFLIIQKLVKEDVRGS